MTWRIPLCILIGFLLGSLNGAIVISRIFMKEDVREKGSGNAGMTNFGRNYGGWGTVAVLLIDCIKVVAACLLVAWLLPQNPTLGKMVAGVAAQVGHIFPVFFKFRGGKGILCAGTLALMMDWRVFLIIFTVFLILFLLTKYVSLGSVSAAIAYAPAFAIFFHNQPWIWGLAIFMACLATFMHRSNIVRLLHGEESKTYLFKSKRK